jgi:serine/threonine protein kinase
MELPANFPPGVCPACLMQQGLSQSTFIGGVGSGGGSTRSNRRRSWIPPEPAELTPHFPQLEIVELLGQGGMGAVYKVRQKDLDRWAALKILPDDVAHDPTFAERFQREARALALLGHQHIVIVYEFGQRDGIYFLLMEYIDGVTLRHAIRAGQVSAKEALSIVTQICDALQFAHEEGVVHRDIKPENILIDKRGRVKIADFGLAKLLGGSSVEVPSLTGTHQVMGTPMYMAPEQMEGTRGVDHRADIFSLGVVFYELLTGELPLGRFAPPSQKYRLDVRLDEVVLRSLEKEPDRRYQQASDVKVDIESIRDQPPTTRKSKLKSSRRSWTPLGVLATVLMIAVGGFALMISAGAVTTWLAYHDNNSRVASQNWSASQQVRARRDEAIQEYQARLKEEAAKQEAIKKAEIASLDPNEANAIVQFTSEGPRLHPDFGADVLSSEQRQAVNQILTDIHQKYLAIESKFSTSVMTNDQRQVTTINTNNDFLEQVYNLENQLWTEVDAQLPVKQQRFLRQNLPLYAENQKPLPLVTTLSEGAMGMMMGGADSGGGSRAGGSMMGMPGMAPAAVRGDGGENLGYAQLLGWKKSIRPIVISIGRRGKWYTWTIDYASEMSGPSSQGGEAPQLPSGIRRFWKGPASDPNKSPSSHLPAQSQLDSSIFSGMPSEPSTPNHPEHLDDLTEFNRNPTVEESYDIPFFTPGASVPFNREPPFTSKERETGEDINPTGDQIPMEVSTPRKPDAPSPSVRTLDESLRALDELRAGDKTSWSDVELQTQELLNQAYQFVDPENPLSEVMGRIYGQAAHVYGQSDIRGHSSDVARHARMAIKYDRDPIRRGELYMYLGSAAEVRDDDPSTFVERRANATRWYLKGYAELLPFRLPDVAPELPGLGGKREELPAGNHELDAEQVALEVQRAAQLRTRKEAQFIRDLVQKRDVYVMRLRELFGRLHEIYDKDQNARQRLRALAVEVLTDGTELDGLLERTFPQPPEPPA